MQKNMSGFWQLSPLTDLSIPQGDLQFPGAISQILPNALSEQAIAEQEWHLMHDFDLNEQELSHPAVDLVFAGVDHFAEIRVNGVAVMDCDGSELVYRKDVRAHLQEGRNRIEVLFLEYDEDDLLIESNPPLKQCPLGEYAAGNDPRMGIWAMPYLQFISHVRLEYVATEQIWHHGGGCEFKVDLYYKTYRPGLLSALVKFNGMTYSLPIDVRKQQASALFQIEAPRYTDLASPNSADAYQLTVELDGQEQVLDVVLNRELCATHCPL
ncbi:glycosyl hydrolase 2 galactose-binding domain-containing protein [Vibrio sp. E150_011]